MAGIKRMGLENLITEVISEDTMIPAIGQGAIGIETRVDDEFINEIIKPLNHEDTAICVTCRKSFSVASWREAVRCLLHVMQKY